MNKRQDLKHACEAIKRLKMYRRVSFLRLQVCDDITYDFNFKTVVRELREWYGFGTDLSLVITFASFCLAFLLTQIIGTY